MFSDNTIFKNLCLTNARRRYNNFTDESRMIKNNKIRENNINVHILTDSNYYNKNFMMSISDLLNYKHINVHLITIDNTENNYNISNYSAGGLFFRTLRGYNFIDEINTMKCFNNYHFNDSYLYFVNIMQKKVK